MLTFAFYQDQKGFPEELFAVKMYALTTDSPKRVHRTRSKVQANRPRIIEWGIFSWGNLVSPIKFGDFKVWDLLKDNSTLEIFWNTIFLTLFRWSQFCALNYLVYTYTLPWKKKRKKKRAACIHLSPASFCSLFWGHIIVIVLVSC